LHVAEIIFGGLQEILEVQKFFAVKAYENFLGAEEMQKKTHFLVPQYATKRKPLLGLPLRYYKDNTFGGKMQMAF
jgi:hypothetical protein